MSFAYLIKRLIRSVIVLFMVTFVVFFLIRSIPGDPVRLMLPMDATNAQVEAYRERMGFNQPLINQYYIYLSDLLAGNLGESLRSKRPVATLILERMPATIELATAGTIISLLVALPLGTIAALKRGTIFDRAFMYLTMIGQSVPIFWLGIMLILIFSVQLGWLPTSGRGTFKQLVLPAITLSTYFMALLARITRSSVLEVINQTYVITAKAKGLKNNAIIIQHVWRNALIPIVTILGLQVGTLLGGSVITETVFAWPGVGTLAIGAIYNRDYPLIQGTILISAFFFVFINMLVDFSYMFFDPRIRYDD